MLKGRENIWGVGEENQPKERSNGNDYIYPFSVENEGISEIGNDDGIRARIGTSFPKEIQQNRIHLIRPFIVRDMPTIFNGMKLSIR
jgi:hypothetical protein